LTLNHTMALSLNRKVVLLGAGRMGSAVLQGLVRDPQGASQVLSFYEVHQPTADAVVKSTGVKQSMTLEEALAPPNNEETAAGLTVVFAVKPQVFPDVASEVAAVLKPGALIVSMMAGVSSSTIRDALEGADVSAVVRTMPNIPLTVGMGSVAVMSDGLTDEQVQAAKDVFGPSAATLVTVPENQIDAVTAVSGSGPAFVFRFVEQMIEAAKEQGIEEETARKLVLGTMKGSVEMLEQAHPLTPGELTDRVCSKGGTTLAGLEKLDELGFSTCVRSCVARAAERGRELNQLAVEARAAKK